MIADNWPTVRCFVCAKVFSRHPDLPNTPAIAHRCVRHRRTRLSAEDRSLDMFYGGERPIYGELPPVPGAVMNHATGKWELR